MPELPEVETVCRQLQPKLQGQVISRVVVRNHSLRWPVSAQLPTMLSQRTILQVERRAKYLLLQLDRGTVLVHFGMSGSLQLMSKKQFYRSHDHVIVDLSNGQSLRFNDPRRFGCFLYIVNNYEAHPLLAKLGPEPFAASCNSDYLYELARRKRLATKLFLMDSHVIAGVGNIYANESLFYAGIHPQLPVNRLSKRQCELLLQCVRRVLEQAIRNNGTTFKDFRASDGGHGRFQNSLAVYGRDGKPCQKCSTILQKTTLGQRYTVFCPKCQEQVLGDV